MGKKEKNTIEETKDTEIVELKDEDLSTITAGAETPKKGGGMNNGPSNLIGYGVVLEEYPV